MPVASGPRKRGLGWRLLIIVAILAALWSALAAWWLPGFMRPRIEQAATEALGTPVRIRAIAVHPWTLGLDLEGLHVGPPSAPLLTLAQAHAQLSLESLWRLAPVLRRVDLIRPRLWVEREAADRFNFTPLLTRLRARPAAPADASPARFAVFNIALQDGQIRYSDRVLGQSHVIDQLHVGVPFVSNLPSFVDVEVKPSLKARVDGSQLALEGDTLPFQPNLRATVRLKWEQVDLSRWLAAAQALLPPAWRMQATGGRLNADLALNFEARKPPAVPLFGIQGGLRIDQLAVAMPAAPGVGEVQAGWQSLSIDGLDLQPLARRVALGSVRLDGLRWRSHVPPPWATSSRLSLEPAPEPAPSSSDAAGKAEAEGLPWTWRLGRLQLGTGRIEAQTTASGPAWPALVTLAARAEGLSSDAKAAPAAWQLEAQDEHGSRLAAQGHIQAARQTVDARLSLDGAAVSPWLAPLAAEWPLPWRVDAGRLSVQAELTARLRSASALEPAVIQLVSGQVALADLAAVRPDAAPARQATRPADSAKDRDHLRLATLQLSGLQGQLDLSPQAALRLLRAGQLELEGLDAALTRGPRGELLGMVMDDAPPSRQPARAASARRSRDVGPSERGAAGPQVTLQGLHCAACQVRVLDRSVQPAARFELHDADLRVDDISQDPSRPLAVALDARAQGQGRIQFKGRVQPQPLHVDAQLNVAGLDLRAVQPYIDPFVNVTVAGAKAQLQGQLRLSQPPGGVLQARYKGLLGLRDVRVLDRVNDADFLSWQALSLDGTELVLDGDAVDANLGRVALRDFYGRLIVNPSGQLNVAGILRHEAGGQTRSLTTPESASPASSVSPASQAAARPASGPGAQPLAVTTAQQGRPLPKLRWQQVKLARGRVDFTDNYIQPHYSARLTRIEGEVSAVSSTRPEPATVKVSGSVDDAAPLLISGRLHPLGPRLYTDIEGSAKGIELTRLTPYAARYAGYAIEKGTLSVTVHYKVDGGKLEASNQIFLDQLTFGDKADSPDATTLPVQFAVSLLKNSRGEIDVNLPISGSLDDPEFSVGGIIWRVLVNLVTKAVTAPFSWLAGGDGSQELGFVPFDPGQANLSDSARARLDTLAAKLVDRPGLKLEATGRADPAVDEEGLRQAHVGALMRAAKARATGQPIGEVEVGPQERATWLAAAYKAADIKKPRNLIGLAKTLPDAEMEALLRASAPAGPEALRLLANQRGDRVKAYLARKLPPERVLLTASKVGRDGLPEDKGPASRVQFEVR